MRTDSEQETEDLGESLGRILFPGAVILLNGEIGAGKTVFARGVGRGLGVYVPIQSPTFTLMNAHSGRLPFYHFDLYRLNSEEELFELGLDEALDGEGVSLVEWAGKFADFFTMPALIVWITSDGSTGRQILFQAGTESYQAVLRQLITGGQVGANPGN
ncbi:MAG: tRNA (adenosine(37)-N6)-threonylcarbamoyltransferase complex ATPase subunit type 1 TsaE [Dethiobacter sp.]|nr:tRNA (adenosine(37)-N6)-threonylcarbamoyltransferase complex ATPase subunit type 1 TsaE [Dethiobacter sp.]MBS3901583.1 tRNA (adenosine(37)-N6)-threonylcarbamoyltransferase complex ATPase subunit type 1 TsaE [Dethiobacter sp.]MBS3988881.1 tRNA (adenosine(37)-N6)-threonylcarbamoyltransferase complex ATPase subunit type 1 TsaE [Dethiobacter sp.]